MKSVSTLTDKDKKEIEEILNDTFCYEDFTISLIVRDSVSLGFEHDDGMYTEVDFKIFEKAKSLLKEYGYGTK